MTGTYVCPECGKHIPVEYFDRHYEAVHGQR